jgi:multidrug efflux pump subunit AcrB
MWIVRLALRRPHTFFVLVLLLMMIVGPLTILRTPTDIFPNIDIPVLSAIWTYDSLAADEIERHIVLNYERGLSVAVKPFGVRTRCRTLTRVTLRRSNGFGG